MFGLFDFISERGESVLEEWVSSERLSKRDLGQLNQKLDMLAQHGSSLPPRLLAGPIQKQKHIYKLIVHGDRMLRPMLCKGPLRMDSEYTLLLGAIEANGVLDHHAREAEANRIVILGNEARRMPHERYW